jgi:hypothetical protein
MSFFYSDEEIVVVVEPEVRVVPEVVVPEVVVSNDYGVEIIETTPVVEFQIDL